MSLPLNIKKQTTEVKVISENMTHMAEGINRNCDEEIREKGK